jgi:hypothetical protein
VKRFWWTLVYGVLAGLVIGSSALFKAHADPIDWTTATYAAKSATAVCETLTVYPTQAGVLGVMQGIQEDGFTTGQAAQIVVIAVQSSCPRFWPLLEEFANTAPKAVSAV